LQKPNNFNNLANNLAVNQSIFVKLTFTAAK